MGWCMSDGSDDLTRRGRGRKDRMYITRIFTEPGKIGIARRLDGSPSSCILIHVPQLSDTPASLEKRQILCRTVCIFH